MDRRGSGTNFTGPISVNGDEVENTITVEIKSEELLALNATPKEIIPAPRISGDAHIVTSMEIYKPDGTAYVVGVGEDFVLRYTDASGTIVTGTASAGFLDQTTAETRVEVPQSAVGTATISLDPTADAPVVANILLGEVTGGDTSVIVKVYYRTVPTVITVPSR